MRKFYTILLTLFTVTSVALAQPAMIKKGYINNKLTEVDTLCRDEGNRTLTPEIYAIYDDIHFQHPSTVTCPFWYVFGTTENYSWWKWELNGQEFDTPEVEYGLEHPNYIKVTVGNDNGDTGSDSIWFDVKDHFEYDSIMLEVDENGHSSIFMKFSPQEVFAVTIHRSNNNTSWQLVAGFHNWHGEPVPENGEIQLSDQDVEFNNDEQWTYHFDILDTCRYTSIDIKIPGMFLATIQENDEWMLDMKTTINQFGPLNDFDYVYVVYTIDQYGQRHHFTDENGPVVLQQNATSWTIPGPHVDPYYQVGVALVHEDGSYEILSLSKKVENPLLDPTGIEEDSQAFMVYPNPAQGRFTVEGTGKLMISNMFGQTILNKEIDGKTTIELPQGMYFVKLGGETRKIVVE
ncbi:MAG: T9SS type A sorting domain-containing protein [Bacteroidales bacterium]|nr:T9SS type A sorting domain-containing protein [Bacteroidales bacterium]